LTLFLVTHVGFELTRRALRAEEDDLTVVVRLALPDVGLPTVGSLVGLAAALGAPEGRAHAHESSLLVDAEPLDCEVGTEVGTPRAFPTL